jgi:hypothetical protein
MARLEGRQAFCREQEVDIHRGALIAVLVQRERADQRIGNALIVQEFRYSFQGPMDVRLAHEKPRGVGGALEYSGFCFGSIG